MFREKLLEFFLQKDLLVWIKYVSLQSQIRGRDFSELGSAGVDNLLDVEKGFRIYFKILHKTFGS